MTSIKQISTALIVVSLLGGAFAGTAAANHTVEAGTDSGSIEVTAVDDSSATAISSPDVFIQDADGNVVHTAKGVSAPYTVQVPTGDYTVTVNADGYGASTQSYTVTTDTTTSNSYTLSSVTTTGSVEATVNDPDGNAVGSATTYLVDLNGNVVDTMTTDANGLASYTSVSTGDYTVEAQHADYASASSDTFTVSDNTLAIVTVSLSAAGGALFGNSNAMIGVVIALVILVLMFGGSGSNGKGRYN